MTPYQFKAVSTREEREDGNVMLEVISINNELYSILPYRFKNNPEYINILISQNPGIEKIIEKEQETKNAQKQEEKRKKEEEKIEKLKQEYNNMGKNHPNLILINNFLKSNISKKIFCRQHNIDIAELDRIIKEVMLVYPEIAEELAKKSQKASAVHLGTVDDINKKLLSGEMSVEEYSREYFKGKKVSHLISNIKDIEKRKQFHTLIISAIANGNLKMMDFKRLFSEEYDFQTIKQEIDTYMKIATKEIPELQGRDKPINNAAINIKNLQKYSKPFQRKDFVGSSIGYTDAEGNIKMIPITEEYVSYAKKYLQLEDEYLCYTTMNTALTKLVKGEITFEDIDKRISNISVRAVVANAINSGITIDEVSSANSIQRTNGKTKIKIVGGV